MKTIIRSKYVYLSTAMASMITLWLLVVTSGVNSLTYREASQFTATPDCTVDEGVTGASMEVTYKRRQRTTTITTNHLPDHHWQCVNPNNPAQDVKTYSFSEPTILEDDEVYCLPGGAIGFAKNGVKIYNPFTSGGENAAELEVMDCNGGHSDGGGNYHYHSLPDNGVVYDSSDPSAQFIGVAFDGNPIYTAGPNFNMDDLDICHGTYVNGKYRYIASADHYPYFLGCYRSAPMGVNSRQGKCSGMAAGAACSCQYGVTVARRSVSPKFKQEAKRATCDDGFCGEVVECGRNKKKTTNDHWIKKKALLKTLLDLLQ